tara:strand:+ start:7352 stop:8275 length:924 start_codon:yes stop_codon:yes gene_type:complete
MDKVYDDDIWTKSSAGKEETKTYKILESYCNKHDQFVFSLVDLLPDNKLKNNIIVTDNFIKKKHIALYPEFYGNYFYKPKYTERLPTKLFCCFINRADSFRQSWLYQFERCKILDKGAVSYRLEYRKDDIAKEISTTPSLLFEHLYQGNEIFAKEHNILKYRVPFTTFETTLEQAIIDSKISLVLETYFDKTHGVAFSEKIFRNLLLPRPFLLFNNPGAIQHLRSCGFDVFDDIVDHSYDNIIEGVPKQIHILEQTKKFALIEYSTKLVDRLQEGCNNNINKLLELKNLWPTKLQSVVEKLENNELH